MHGSRRKVHGSLVGGTYRFNTEHTRSKALVDKKGKKPDHKLENQQLLLIKSNVVLVTALIAPSRKLPDKRK